MKDIKTTITGSISAVAVALLPFFPEYKEVLSGIIAVAGSLFAIFSKDSTGAKPFNPTGSAV